MIRFPCPHCQKKLKAPETAEGRRVSCPKCGSSVEIPSQGIEPAHQPAPALPTAIEHAPATSLINCSDCGRAISREAASCPGCGAPNRWTHPEIQRFLRSIHTFGHIPRFDIHAEKFTLIGVDVGSRDASQAVSSFLNGFSLIVPLDLNGVATLIAGHVGSQMLSKTMSQNIRAFRIDFRNTPPTWETTNDKHWEDILEFFGLARPGGLSAQPASAASTSVAAVGILFSLVFAWGVFAAIFFLRMVLFRTITSTESTTSQERFERGPRLAHENSCRRFAHRIYRRLERSHQDVHGKSAPGDGSMFGSAGGANPDLDGTRGLQGEAGRTDLHRRLQGPGVQAALRIIAIWPGRSNLTWRTTTTSGE